MTGSAQRSSRSDHGEWAVDQQESVVNGPFAIVVRVVEGRNRLIAGEKMAAGWP
jgi:hypothetical protein